MKIAALTQKEWLAMLIQGSWLPSVLTAVFGCILGFDRNLFAFSFGFFLQGIMVLGDGWWCVKMHADYALFWLFASFMTRLLLSILIIFSVFKSGLPFAPVGAGYLISMAYCMYLKMRLQHRCSETGEACHNH